MTYRIILSGYIIFKVVVKLSKVFTSFLSSLVAINLVVLVVAKILSAFRLLRHHSQNSVTDVSANFLPPCWGPSRWAPTWFLHTKL